MRSALKSLICATSRCCQLSDYSTSTFVINAVLFPDNLSDSWQWS